MIQLLTRVNIIDNSGGSKGQCIKILNPHGRLYAKIGDIILVSIKETAKQTSNIKKGSKTLKLSNSSNAKVNKGSLYKALVVRTNVNYSNNHKRAVNFQDNAVVLLKSSNLNNTKSKDFLPLGTRIKGPISRHLSPLKFQKILSLTKYHI